MLTKAFLGLLHLCFAKTEPSAVIYVQTRLMLNMHYYLRRLLQLVGGLCNLKEHPGHPPRRWNPCPSLYLLLGRLNVQNGSGKHQLENFVAQKFRPY